MRRKDWQDVLVEVQRQSKEGYATFLEGVVEMAVEFVVLELIVVQSVVAQTVVAASLAARSVVVELDLAQSVIVGSELGADLGSGLGIWYPNETFWLVRQLTLSVVERMKSCVSQLLVQSTLPDPQERAESQVQQWCPEVFCG